MLETLLKEQIRGDPKIAQMLATYKNKPAFFFMESPLNIDIEQQKPCYPFMDFNIIKQYDHERDVSGTLLINIWCTGESLVAPHDIEGRLIELISGTFYNDIDDITIYVNWNRSDTFNYELPKNEDDKASSKIFGISVTFDLIEFCDQTTSDPDPIQALNNWTRANFPGITVINCDITPVWKPTDDNPAIYWRFESASSNNLSSEETSVVDKQSYAVNWYTGKFAAQVITASVKERNSLIKAIAEQIQLEGEVPLTDGSPMFVKIINIRYKSDPLREGQLLLTGYYGVLVQPRKEYAQFPLNNANITNLLEVNSHGKNQG